MTNKHSELQNLRAMVEKDPLFSAEGLDLEKAKFALDELALSLHRLKKSWTGIVPKSFFYKYPPELTAHPISFLYSFLISEQERRVFLKNPTYENAMQLLKIWKKTLNEYKKGISSYKSALLALQKIENIDPNVKLGYFDIAPCFHDLIGWVDLLMENSVKLELHISDCKSILDGNSIGKDFGENKSIAFDGKININNPIKTSVENDELLKIIESRFQIKERFDSVIYPLGHFNNGKVTPRKFNVLIAKTDDLKSDLLYVLLADELFFLNIKRGHFIGLVIYRPLIEAGLEYWYQPATTFYSNLDVSYQAEIATVVDLKRRKFNNEQLVKSQHCSLLDLLIGTGIYYNNRFTKLIKIYSYHKDLPKLSFFYFARAYPSLYFLSFNNSVWRLDKKPFINATRFGPTSHYEKFSDLRYKIPFDKMRRVVEISTERMKYFKKELKGF
jgi:hypothetical protein